MGDWWSDKPDWWLDPDWEEGGRVHNWRSYISEELRSIWGSFTPEQRRIIAESAAEQANNEEWD